MKKLIYLLLLPLALAVVAYGGKSGSSDKESVLAGQDSVDAHGLQRMQNSEAETDIKFKGRGYHSLVSRTPDESLLYVPSDMGDTHVDNKIVLRIIRRNENMLDRTFTRNDFSSVVDVKPLSRSVLEGIVCDKTTPEGIVYTVSVRYPQTNLHVPLSIIITINGEMSIRKVDMLEDDYTEETPEQTYEWEYEAFLTEELHKCEST